MPAEFKVTNMHGRELAALIENRHSALQRLLEISGRQIDAIRGGRMSELMRLLSEKQSPLNQLNLIAQSLRTAVTDDHAARQWDSESQRSQCREQQDQCEQMHLELLAIEAESESALQQSRLDLQQQLDRVDGGRNAANGYARNQVAATTTGGTLDLSSLD